MDKLYFPHNQGLWLDCSPHDDTKTPPWRVIRPQWTTWTFSCRAPWQWICDIWCVCVCVWRDTRAIVTRLWAMTDTLPWRSHSARLGAAINSGVYFCAPPLPPADSASGDAATEESPEGEARKGRGCVHGECCDQAPQRVQKWRLSLSNSWSRYLELDLRLRRKKLSPFRPEQPTVDVCLCSTQSM